MRYPYDDRAHGVVKRRRVQWQTIGRLLFDAAHPHPTPRRDVTKVRQF